MGEENSVVTVAKLAAGTVFGVVGAILVLCFMFFFFCCGLPMIMSPVTAAPYQSGGSQ